MRASYILAILRRLSASLSLSLSFSQFSSRSSGHAIIPVLTVYSNIEKHGGTEIMVVFAERRSPRRRLF